MDKSAIEAEISAQSKLVDSIPIDLALVTEIDRHIKEKENQLNERLVHVRAFHLIRHFLPPNAKILLATNVDEKVWNSLRFTKVFPGGKGTHEELSYDRTAKGFGFFYTSGEVTFEVGLVQDFGGEDWYVRIIDDKRDTVKLTGASVEIKLRAFQHLKELLMEINDRANNVATKLEDYAKNYMRSKLK